MRRSVALALVLPAVLGVFVFPALAWAQAGLYLTPSLTLAGVYDDNIFNETGGKNRNAAAAAGHGRVGDLSGRLTPGLALGYQSDPLKVLLKYSFTFERFLQHSELDSDGGFQSGTATFNYVPSRGSPWTISGSGFFSRSQNSANADPLTGLPSGSQGTALTGFQGGRQDTTTYGVASTAKYQFTSLLGLSGGYRFNHTEVNGGTASTVNGGTASTINGFDVSLGQIPVILELGLTATANYGLTLVQTDAVGVSSTARNHLIGLSLAKEVKPRDTFSLNYEGTILERDGADTSVSHSGTVGWTHRFSADTSAGGELGVRVTDGVLSPEVRVNVNTRSGLFRELTISFTTTSEVRALLDQGGTVVRTQTYSGVLSYQTPIQYLTVTATPSIVQIIGDKGGARDSYFYTFFANVTYSYPLQRWLNAFARYEFSYRDSGKDVFQPAGQEIIHNIVSVGLTATYPYRIY